MNIIQNRFKYFLLSALFSLTITSSLTYATDAAMNYGEDSTTTPQRVGAVSTVTVMEPTPGQRTAQLQAEVFIPERFIDVFGEEGFNKLLMTLDSSPERGQKSFNTLADATISYDDQRKRILIRKISKFMGGYFSTRCQDPIFNHLYGLVLNIKTDTEDVPYNRINESSARYFQNKYPGSVVTFTDKQDGVQLGTVVRIQTIDGRTLKYYVKTHSSGLISDKSSPAKTLRPQELLVYKVLEELGVGCESHFFGRDDKNFYIATLDANTEGSFKEYSKFDRDQLDDIAPLWGCLTELSNFSHENEENHQAVEAEVGRDLIAQSFIFQISYLDMLARLMRLVDLQTNGTNYGFLQQRGSLSTLKVIDFRLRELEEEDDYKITENHFRGFLKGNGSFHYITADKAVCYALRNRPQHLRVGQVRQVFESRLSDWTRVIDTSQSKTLESLNSLTLTDPEQYKLTEELNLYARDLKSNFQLFKTMLAEWHPDGRL